MNHIEINKPIPYEKFQINKEVVFSGIVDDEIKKVQLFAESEYSLGEAGINEGQWTLSYKFNTTGLRNISAIGYDSNNNIVCTDKTFINVLDETLMNQRLQIPRPDQILKVLEKLNYVVYDDHLKLNIVGIRSKNRVANQFDDLITVIYNDEDERLYKNYPITTDPGTYHLKACKYNHKGCAILKEDQYKDTYQLGLHQGKYRALVQTKDVSVYRDSNKDNVLDMKSSSLQKGHFGINIHRSSKTGSAKYVDRYSAGCQVFENGKDYDEFIRLCDTSSKIHGNSFTYTLVNEKDFDS